MPSYPRSLGCQACRKQKKGCDLAKPKCGRCTRIGIKCIDNGVKRWTFRDQSDIVKQTTAIRHNPCNELTRTTAGLIHILQIKDVRYDIRAYGSQLITEIPSHLGISPELDITVNAVVALYNNSHFHSSRVKALASYGQALKATSRILQDPKQAILMKLETVVMLWICQIWVDRRHADQLCIVISVLFREAVLQGQAGELGWGNTYALCQIAVLATMLDPTFELGPWFWDIYRTYTRRGVNVDQGASLHSVQVNSISIAEAAMFLRKPAKHLPELRRIYEGIQFERSKILQLLSTETTAAMTATEAVEAVEVRNQYLGELPTQLALGSVINKVLRCFDDDPKLVKAAQDDYWHTVDLSRRLEARRPHGASFVPDILKSVWASTADVMNGTELWEMLKDYENDVEGANYEAEALELKHHIDMVAQTFGSPGTTQSTPNEQSDMQMVQEHEAGEPTCIIL